MPINPKPIIKGLNSIDFARLYGRLYKIQKQEALGNYFCLKMIYKLARQQILQKIMNILEAWKPTEDMKFRIDIFFFTCPSTYELIII